MLELMQAASDGKLAGLQAAAAQRSNSVQSRRHQPLWVVVTTWSLAVESLMGPNKDDEAW